ncbi:hypothetical protein [Acidovorax sp. FJL06]|uniref:hypothetical protein n=1 Tax=Acidovorax sp. FJL06 TaxID=2153365 RepID=UPI0018F6D089|nr:hypothetical protein [Acidovorax sp. FJL06]
MTPTHTGAAELPEALRLADAIDPFVRKESPDHLTSKVAADELRSLYAENRVLMVANNSFALAQDRIEAENKALHAQVEALSAAQAGVPMAQEPKYTVNGTHVINRATGEAIPHDEPVFVFRARDALGVRALEAYLALIGEREPVSAHADAVRRRIADFQRFAAEHPGRMKWPDTQPSPSPAPAEGVHKDAYPEKCPITGRPYFMSLDHPELGMVPTYGGPYDSYTIPAPDGEPTDPWHERELRCERYDHDAGWWTEGGEPVPLRIIHEDVLFALEEHAEQATTPAPAQPPHVQNSPENEHIADDVSKIGLESNMTAQKGQEGGRYYPQLPEPFIGVQDQPWGGHAEVIRSAIGEDGVIPCFTAGQMVAYADATHAARAAPQPATADAVSDTALIDWLQDNACDLRCVLTAEDDFDWVVIEHHIGKPHEREIGRGYSFDLRAAIRAAQRVGVKP